MKTVHISRVGALLALLFLSNSTYTQQFPIFNGQVLHQDLSNPGRFPQSDLNHLRVAYQQRELQIAGMESAAQYLDYQSRPISATQRFSWGFQVSNDQIFTEQRIAASPRIAVALLNDKDLQVSLGISAGVIALQSNYADKRIYHNMDPAFLRPVSTFQLDAGLGGHFRYRNEFLKARGGVAATQLPGNFLSQDTADARILPHWTGELTVLASPFYNLQVGPRIFYRNTLNQGETVEGESPSGADTTWRETTALAAGQLDIGLVAEFERQNMWIAGAYRINKSALTAGFGMQLTGADTMQNPEAMTSFLDLNFGAAYPLQSGVGPSVELGLAWRFGKPRQETMIDTLRWAQNFWKTESWMTAHKESRIGINAPAELEAFQEIHSKNVYLTYEFPDVSKLYMGETMYLEDTLVRHVGLEWEGIDGLMNGLVTETIREALTPDTFRIRDPENLEPLKNLSWIEFYSFLRLDENAASFCSNVVYEGELAGELAQGDSLLIPIVVDDRDTVLIVRKGQCMTNLELAAVKLVVMRSRFHYAFHRYYGDQFRLYYAGTLLEFNEDNLPAIKCKELRIVTNHPHMQVFQTNFIDMKFRRYARYLDLEDENWTPRVPKELDEEKLDLRVGGDE